MAGQRRGDLRDERSCTTFVSHCERSLSCSCKRRSLIPVRRRPPSFCCTSFLLSLSTWCECSDLRSRRVVLDGGPGKYRSRVAYVLRRVLGDGYEGPRWLLL